MNQPDFETPKGFDSGEVAGPGAPKEQDGPEKGPWMAGSRDCYPIARRRIQKPDPAPKSAGMAAYRERARKTEKPLQSPHNPDQPLDPRFANISAGDIIRDVIGVLLFFMIGWQILELADSWEWLVTGAAFIVVAVASPLLTSFWSSYPELSSVSMVVARTPGSAVSVIKWVFLAGCFCSFCLCRHHFASD